MAILWRWGIIQVIKITNPPKVLREEGFTKKVWSCWWFWVVVVIVFIVGWRAYDYWQYTQSGAYKQDQEYRQLYKDALEYAQQVETAKSEEEAMLRADTHGSATPEGTLELFVDALREKDASLASKYYLPWLQDEMLGEMQDWMRDDSLIKFIAAYDEGVIKRDESYVIGLALDVYPAGDQYPYSIEMRFNEFNSIWKISEF